jgi:hypothetical protein
MTRLFLHPFLVGKVNTQWTETSTPPSIWNKP